MPRPQQPPSPASPASPAMTACTSFLPNDTMSVSPRGLAKGVWTEEEHGLFLDGLKRFPHGPWKAITAHIGTRSIRQVQTHAQKYMEKVQRRARGLKTALPRLVRRDHRIDEEIEPWWARENGMFASSPSRTTSTGCRRRHRHRLNSNDAVTSTHSSTSESEPIHKEAEVDALDLEPLPLYEELTPASPLPTLEECLAVVSECLAEPIAYLQLDFELEHTTSI